MQAHIADAIIFLRQHQAAIREEIKSIDKAIKLLTKEPKPEKQQKQGKFITLDTDGLQRKRGRPAKVIYVPENVQEKREKLRLNDKIVRILRSKYRFLHEKEIVTACINNYASERTKAREEVAASVRQSLEELQTDRKIVEFSGMDMKKSYWGFEEWINRKGEIQPENMYIPTNS